MTKRNKTVLEHVRSGCWLCRESVEASTAVLCVVSFEVLNSECDRGYQPVVMCEQCFGAFAGEASADDDGRLR